MSEDIRADILAGIDRRIAELPPDDPQEKREWRIDVRGEEATLLADQEKLASGHPSIIAVLFLALVHWREDLRALRREVERHEPWDHPARYCVWCKLPYPCPPLRDLAEYAAKEAK